MQLEVIEQRVRQLGAAAGLITLAIAFWHGVWHGLQRSRGRTTGIADRVLRARVQAVFGFLWTAVCAVLWRPIPLTLSTTGRSVALTLGSLLYFPGLALYLWGAKTLGDMYRASSGLGVQLDVSHELITHGPFRFMRHPLYLGLELAALGGLLLYRTWTFAFVAVNFLGLVFRARREEEALAAEFGAQWQQYARHVPAWIPLSRASIGRRSRPAKRARMATRSRRWNWVRKGRR